MALWRQVFTIAVQTAAVFEVARVLPSEPMKVWSSFGFTWEVWPQLTAAPASHRTRPQAVFISHIHIQRQGENSRPLAHFGSAIWNSFRQQETPTFRKLLFSAAFVSWEMKTNDHIMTQMITSNLGSKTQGYVIRVISFLWWLISMYCFRGSNSDERLVSWEVFSHRWRSEQRGWVGSERTSGCMPLHVGGTGLSLKETSPRGNTFSVSFISTPVIHCCVIYLSSLTTSQFFLF